MSDSQKKYWTDDPDMVEQYVLRKLSPEEKRRLDAEISDCEPCKALIEQEREIAAGIRRHGRDRMKAGLRKQLRRERSSQFYSFQYIGMAAAVVVIAIGIGLYQIWFSDLVAPKRFGNQQIIITTKQDTSAKDAKRDQAEESRQSERLTAERSERTMELRKEPAAAEQRTPPARAAEVPVEALADGSPDEARVQPSAAAAQQAAGAAAEEQVPSTIWLIGNVVMISERTGEAMQKSSADRSLKERSTRGATSSEMAAANSMHRDRIVLRRRAVKDLPSERIRHQAEPKQIESMLERTADTLVLTLYDDSMNDETLEKAVVESFTDDLIVVALPNQRITYRLPSGWNQSSRSR